MLFRSAPESQQVTFGSGFEKKVLLKKISEMEDLPSLDVNVITIMKLLDDENVVIEDVVDAIERDQALVAKLLKIINSAYFSLRKTVDSVERAVVLLGILKVKHVVYSASIVDFYSDDHIVEWNHAYTSSLLVSKLIQDHGIPAAAELSLSMLMHDIGKVVLRRFSANRFKAALALADADSIPVFQAEEIAIGIDHTEVGGMLLEKWGMPPEMALVARLHHCMEIPAAHVGGMALVQFADWIDCSAREIRCLPPRRELLEAAGLATLDGPALIEKHREFVEGSEGSQ